METDKLGFKSKPFTWFRIFEFRVEVRKVGDKILNHFCAYVKLPKSQHLSDSYLGDVTYRKDEWVGVDTGHAFNEKHTEAEKLASALHQIEFVIKQYKKATEDGYYEED